MAELLTARDKFPQVEQQLKTAEMERYVLSIRVKYDPGALSPTADDFQKSAHQALKAESDGGRAALITWDHKLSVLWPIYDALNAEVNKANTEKTDAG